MAIKKKKGEEVGEVEIPKPMEIKAYLDEYVIGQERVKEVMSVAVYNHYKRIGRRCRGGVEIEKSNICLVGPTGSGKTHIAKTISRMLDVPFCIADATSLTQAGYVGDDVENVLVRLLQAADYDLERAERGIVFIDEIDKIGRKGGNPSITRDVSGEGVQQALLKIIEGSVVNVPPFGGRKHPEQRMIEVDTTDILFICGGAFEGIEGEVERRCNRGVIGFRSGVEGDGEGSCGVGEVIGEDLVKFGMMPELVGRLPIVVSTEKLGEGDMERILTEPRNALVRQYRELFKIDGIKLEIDKEVYGYIARRAMESGLGARGLRGMMEKVLHEPMYRLPSSGRDRCHITMDYVKSVI